MNERIRVAFFYSASPVFSGGKKMLFRLLSRIDTSTIKPIVYTQHKDPLYERLSHTNIQRHIIQPPGVLKQFNSRILNQSASRYPMIGYQLIKYNSMIMHGLSDFDVIWCDNIKTLLSTALTRIIKGKPLIWNIGLGLDDTGVFLYLKQFGVALSDHIFIESSRQAERVFDSLYYQNREKFTIFNKGVDTCYFDPETTDNKIAFNGEQIKQPAIGTAARINPRKGIDDLIQAVPRIHSEFSDVHLYVAGTPGSEQDEVYKRRLDRLSEQLDVRDQVHFLGWVDSMPEFLNNLDVFVLPSHNEGIPGSVREALSMKVPVVASDVGGVSDVVINNKTGYLVDPNSPEQIARRVRKLLRSPNKKQNMGENGRDLIISNYSIDSYVNQYESFLQEIHRTG